MYGAAGITKGRQGHEKGKRNPDLGTVYKGYDDMLIIITGGAASGKSAHAERILCERSKGSRLYLATMEPFGVEARARIARHRAMRQDKGFETCEWYRNLPALALNRFYDGILLECMSNLLANEMFSSDGDGAGDDLIPRILEGVQQLCVICDCLVIVTNEVFTDGLSYPEETKRYIWKLGALNAALAQMADGVAESICGLLIPLKGDLSF